MKGGLDLIGLLDVLEGLQDFAADGPDLLNNSLEEMAYRVLKEAKKEVPVDTGQLKGSGKVTSESWGYAIKFQTKYARAVHERTDVTHTNGKAFYLRDPFQRIVTTQNIADIISGRIFDKFGVT